MPYGPSIYGVSYYGQLTLPTFDRVGGLLRYSEPGPNYGIVRVDYPTPMFFVNRTEPVTPITMHRYGAHEARIGVTRDDTPHSTVMMLIRENNTVQLSLDRSFETIFDRVYLVRNSTDLTRS